MSERRLDDLGRAFLGCFLVCLAAIMIAATVLGVVQIAGAIV